MPSYDPNKTVVLPSPGGWRAPDAPQANALDEIPERRSTASAKPAAQDRIVALASPILDDVCELRTMGPPTNLAALADHLTNAVLSFESRAYDAGIPKEHISRSMYILCAFIDDAAANTEWGKDGAWASHSVSARVMASADVIGGEKFFEYATSLQKHPETHGDVLELMYVCLCLGFQGRFRNRLDHGSELESTRQALAETLQRSRGPFEEALSPHALNAKLGSQALKKAVRPWHVGVLCALVLLIAFVWMRQGLSSATHPVADQIAALEIKAPEVPLPAPPEKPKLVALLKDEIDQNKLSIPANPKCSGCETVVLRFNSGAATLPAAQEPIVNRVGDVLNTLAGSVLVTGHTDDEAPMRLARFADNQALSRERARSVAEVLSKAMKDPSRIVIEGRADRDWIGGQIKAAKDRPANRRVEITLRPAAGPR